MIKRIFIFLLFNFLAFPVFAEAEDSQVAVSRWQYKLHQLNQGNDVKFRIVQLGDSHTAGGFLTDELRRILQQKWGDGGIGWVYPNQIKGQRNSLVNYSGRQWNILNHFRKDIADFPLGGIVAQSSAQENLQISANSSAYEPQNIMFMIKPLQVFSTFNVIDATGQVFTVSNQSETEWRNFTAKMSLPIQLNAPNQTWQVGLVNIENTQPKGVIVSALGINGAKLSNSQGWRKNWYDDLAQTEADLVILAYGTNEAFNPQLNVEETAQYWRQVIQNIHQKLPDAGILIVGAPESLTQKGKGCGTRPLRLTEMQKMQQEIAQEQGAIYWSWQDAMGGECNMNQWIVKKWAQLDGVHFTAIGYQKIGNQLAQKIMQLSE